ncbi:MAG TPA: histidinol-phosphatase [Candidatus Ventricola intestinavium]|nr:histidinol-phosphatase [Candidatus Ventricola intestinavium]
MKANYHTHTARCGHAEGTDEEYVLAALSQGFDELGFSDHVPWPYASGYAHPHVRMHLSQMEDYLQSIRALKEKYKDRIRILIGFECEYFPDYMGWLADMAAQKELDYLILGNHYENSDETGMYFGSARTPGELRRYVESTVRGMETGLFAYLAHPDLFMRSYPRFDENCRAAARDLCQACREKNLPMEYNTHDRFISYFTRRKSYPHPAFFEIAREEGVRVIIGLDAHEPGELAVPEQFRLARRELEPFGERCLDHIETAGF